MKVPAFYVDFNNRERLRDGGQAVAIVVGKMNPTALEKMLSIGMRVVVYDEETRCEGILRMGTLLDGWVADVVADSIGSISSDEFNRLRAETLRAAFHVVE